MLKLTTAGESHGPGITCILAGLPAGLAVDLGAIDAELARRQSGYGRGGRMAIEKDSVEVLAGVRLGRTTGAPLALFVKNRDSRLDDLEKTPELYAPRPGHADLAGSQATGAPIRDVLERSSARETAARVAAGAVAKRLLAGFGIAVAGHVVRIGPASTDAVPESADECATAEESDVRCLDAAAAEAMRGAVDSAREDGDSLGGVFEVIASGVPAGLGSCTQPEGRLDALLAGAVMSIPAIKGVEVGRARPGAAGFAVAELPGSEVHDEIVCDASATRAGGYARKTNRAGGIEGGVSNGMPVVVRAAMKPIPTLTKPLASVDMRTGEPVRAAKERSDVCAVPAASVVGEAVVAFTLAGALLERLGTGGLEELKGRFDAMLGRLPGPAEGPGGAGQ
ncbi:MAG: chorismate synthase [Planctomycetota bacterium]|jgi:chorismate synthase